VWSRAVYQGLRESAGRFNVVTVAEPDEDTHGRAQVVQIETVALEAMPLSLS
jgi:hypothetical protein